jgi:S-adenosyl-L-methionine hydrolase (adenosine-forming)
LRQDRGMMVFLFTDFGAGDLYVGQIKMVLQQQMRAVAVIDLLHEAPAFNMRASAHLLAALAAQIPPDSVILAVVDPGVGGVRDAVVLNADGKWIVGPDNGLMSVAAARAKACSHWRITWRPVKLSASFHGRDLFAPIVAAITRGEFPAEKAETLSGLGVDFGAADLNEIIYIDHYGNALTGLRAEGVARDARLVIDGRRIEYARVFADAAPGAVFWYENSLGLVEIAANSAHAVATLGLKIGQSFNVATR